MNATGRDRVAAGVRRRWIAVDHPGWVQAHASTVLRTGGTRKGRDDSPATSLLAAWFGGTREGTPDNRIWLASHDDGAWSSPSMVADGEDAHWNPVLANGPDGAIWLFYKVGSRISSWRTMVRRSTDDGRTWSAAVPLVPGDTTGRGPVKNPPLLANGIWLAPGSTETWGRPPAWKAFVDRSCDEGRTWRAVPLPLDRSGLRGAGVIQPALWRTGDDVHALTRSTEGYAFHSVSHDLGESWSPLRRTGLANNNSGLAVVALPSGRVACVHNPASGDWAARCPLVVSVSEDDGLTWRKAVVVEDGITPVDGQPLLVPSLPRPHPRVVPADDGVATDGIGEYSYPAALLDGDELVVTYTWQRRGIVEARIPLVSLGVSSTSGRPRTLTENADKEHP